MSAGCAPPPCQVGPARYAKGQMAVRCTAGGGYKDRAQRLIGDGLNCRWSGRERAYIVSPSKVAKFEALYAAGFDACAFSGKLWHPERGLDGLTLREAMGALAGGEEAAAPDVGSNVVYPLQWKAGAETPIGGNGRAA